MMISSLLVVNGEKLIGRKKGVETDIVGSNVSTDLKEGDADKHFFIGVRRRGKNNYF